MFYNFPVFCLFFCRAEWWKHVFNANSIETKKKKNPAKFLSQKPEIIRVSGVSVFTFQLPSYFLPILYRYPLDGPVPGVGISRITPDVDLLTPESVGKSCQQPSENVGGITIPARPHTQGDLNSHFPANHLLVQWTQRWPLIVTLISCLKLEFAKLENITIRRPESGPRAMWSLWCHFPSWPYQCRMAKWSLPLATKIKAEQTNKKKPKI